MIEKIADGQIRVKTRGAVITATKRFNTDHSTHWQVYTDNASHRAYRGTLGKSFDSIAELEKAYKSLKGVSKLISDGEPVFSGASFITKTLQKVKLELNAYLAESHRDTVLYAVDVYGFILPNGKHSLRDLAVAIAKQYEMNQRTHTIVGTLLYASSQDPIDQPKVTKESSCNTLLAVH